MYLYRLEHIHCAEKKKISRTDNNIVFIMAPFCFRICKLAAAIALLFLHAHL